MFKWANPTYRAEKGTLLKLRHKKACASKSSDQKLLFLVARFCSHRPFLLLKVPTGTFSARISDLRPPSAEPLNIFLQVNLQDEVTKSGTASGELTALASAVSQLPNLKLRGLMAIPAPELNFEQQRKIFSKLREQKNRLNRVLNLALDCLSMGMTDDLEAAVAEGSTHVRIGTAIFGPRNPHK